MSLNWNKLYTYPKTVRSNIDGTRRYEIGDEKLPSVTSIISKTQDFVENLKETKQENILH